MLCRTTRSSIMLSLDGTGGERLTLCCAASHEAEYCRASTELQAHCAVFVGGGGAGAVESYLIISGIAKLLRERNAVIFFGMSRVVYSYLPNKR